MLLFAYRRYVLQRDLPAVAAFFLVTVFSDPVTDLLIVAALGASLMSFAYAQYIRWAAMFCLSLEILAASYSVYGLLTNPKAASSRIRPCEAMERLTTDHPTDHPTDRHAIRRRAI